MIKKACLLSNYLLCPHFFIKLTWGLCGLVGNANDNC